MLLWADLLRITYNKERITDNISYGLPFTVSINDFNDFNEFKGFNEFTI